MRYRRSGWTPEKHYLPDLRRIWCDATIARLTVEQAMYHFISGYTSKIAGTEVGLRDEPEITFSACFGGPFMVHKPAYYAELLRRKIERYGV